MANVEVQRSSTFYVSSLALQIKVDVVIDFVHLVAGCWRGFKNSILWAYTLKELYVHFRVTHNNRSKPIVKGSNYPSNTRLKITYCGA